MWLSSMPGELLELRLAFETFLLHGLSLHGLSLHGLSVAKEELPENHL